MSYDLNAVATQLKTILEGLSGMGTVQIGSPESVGKRVGAWVTLGGLQSQAVAGGLKQAEMRFTCMFVYRLDGNETTAETTLMTLVPAFFQAIHNDKTLAGTVDNAEVNSQTADEPDYQLRAGKEYREYPVIVTATQRSTYEVNP